MQRFTVTENHLKLLRKMYVGWQGCMAGAPEINPKRPYGNSSHLNDICEILTGESIGCVGDAREEIGPGEAAAYADIHRETETALQIVLATGTFKAGDYEADDYRVNWSLLKGE